jgi:NAD(P)-dependent dehydrogenase (short-subunit alcohol dehydrogenase family)
MHPSTAESRTALVTGAASGLGRALAILLARAGWQIALADVNDAGLAETLRQVEAAGGRGRAEHLDVTKPEEWQSLCRRLQADWPVLDLLVNNAGVACAGEVGAFPLEDWRWAIETNLLGAIFGCHACIEWLKQNPGRAHIVNVASIAAALAAPGMAPYSVSKAGVLTLSETLYVELAPHGVGVSVVCSGFFASDLVAKGRFQGDRERQAAENFTLAARITADDVARAIVRAIAGRKLYVVLPARARLLWRLKRLLPGVWLRILAIAYQRHVNTVSSQK